MGRSNRGMKALFKALLFFMVAIGLMFLFSQSLWLKRIMYPIENTDMIRTYALEYSVDPHLVSAVIFVESRFRPEAVSRANARGLMQVTPTTGRWGAERIGLLNYDDEMLFDPEVNIRLGCWYLDNLSRQFKVDITNVSSDRFDEIIPVLAAYNGGSGNVAKWLGNPEYSKDGKTLYYIPFAETRAYVIKVNEAYTVYKEIYPNLGH